MGIHKSRVVSDLYGKPPLVWKDMDIHLVVYETDMENIEKVIPEPLKARTNKVIIWHSHFDLGTTQGAFSETAVYVQVKYNGIEGDYEPFLYVDNHLPLTGGREIWGLSEKDGGDADGPRNGGCACADKSSGT